MAHDVDAFCQFLLDGDFAQRLKRLDCSKRPMMCARLHNVWSDVARKAYGSASLTKCRHIYYLWRKDDRCIRSEVLARIKKMLANGDPDILKHNGVDSVIKTIADDDISNLSYKCDLPVSGVDSVVVNGGNHLMERRLLQVRLTRLPESYNGISSSTAAGQVNLQEEAAISPLIYVIAMGDEKPGLLKIDANGNPHIMDIHGDEKPELSKSGLPFDVIDYTGKPIDNLAIEEHDFCVTEDGEVTALTPKLWNCVSKKSGMKSTENVLRPPSINNCINLSSFPQSSPTNDHLRENRSPNTGSQSLSPHGISKSLRAVVVCKKLDDTDIRRLSGSDLTHVPADNDLNCSRMLFDREMVDDSMKLATNSTSSAGNKQAVCADSVQDEKDNLQAAASIEIEVADDSLKQVDNPTSSAGREHSASTCIVEHEGDKFQDKVSTEIEMTLGNECTVSVKLSNFQDTMSSIVVTTPANELPLENKSVPTGDLLTNNESVFQNELRIEIVVMPENHSIECIPASETLNASESTFEYVPTSKLFTENEISPVAESESVPANELPPKIFGNELMPVIERMSGNQSASESANELMPVIETSDNELIPANEAMCVNENKCTSQSVSTSGLVPEYESVPAYKLLPVINCAPAIELFAEPVVLPSEELVPENEAVTVNKFKLLDLVEDNSKSRNSVHNYESDHEVYLMQTPFKLSVDVQENESRLKNADTTCSHSALLEKNNCNELDPEPLQSCSEFEAHEMLSKEADAIGLSLNESFEIYDLHYEGVSCDDVICVEEQSCNTDCISVHSDNFVLKGDSCQFDVQRLKEQLEELENRKIRLQEQVKIAESSDSFLKLASGTRLDDFDKLTPLDYRREYLKALNNELLLRAESLKQKAEDLDRRHGVLKDKEDNLEQMRIRLLKESSELRKITSRMGVRKLDTESRLNKVKVLLNFIKREKIFRAAESQRLRSRLQNVSAVEDHADNTVKSKTILTLKRKMLKKAVGAVAKKQKLAVNVGGPLMKRSINKVQKEKRHYAKATRDCLADHYASKTDLPFSTKCDSKSERLNVFSQVTSWFNR